MRTIHFHAKLGLVRDSYEDNVFEMFYIESENSVADLFTKVLGNELNQNHLNFIVKDFRLSDSKECLKSNSYNNLQG